MLYLHELLLYDGLLVEPSCLNQLSEVDNTCHYCIYSYRN